MTDESDRFYPGEPGSLAWRVLTAHCASQVFAGNQHEFVKDVLAGLDDPPIGRPCTTVDLIRFMTARKVPEAHKHPMRVLHVVQAMERVGMLYDWGRVNHSQGPMGHTYWLMDDGTPARPGGDLWLGPVFGAELLVPTFSSVSIQLPAHDSEAGLGTGLILDATHILTNAHVAKTIRSGDALRCPIFARPGHATRQPVTDVIVTKVDYHEERDPLGDARDGIDVGILEVKPETDLIPGLRPLGDLYFREPRWDDEVLLFGFPRVNHSTGDPLVVQRAQVTNPLVIERGEVVSPSVKEWWRRDFFLFSAIARPGSSGGPIVARDGCVIGINAQEPLEAVSSAGDTKAILPFYRGVPTSQVVKALDALGYSGLIKLV